MHKDFHGQGEHSLTRHESLGLNHMSYSAPYSQAMIEGGRAVAVTRFFSPCNLPAVPTRVPALLFQEVITTLCSSYVP